MKRILATLAFAAAAAIGHSAVVVEVTSETGKLNTDYFASMTPAVSNSDLINGLVPLEAPSTLVGALTDLTDGNGQTRCLFPDSPSAQPVGSETTITYQLASNQDIGRIRVFSANGDGRAYIGFDVYVSSSIGGPYTLLQSEARGGVIGVDEHNGNDTNNNLAVIVEVKDDASGVLAANVREIQFNIFNCVNTFASPDVCDRSVAIQSQATCEIDVLAPPAAVGEWQLY